MKVNVKVTAYLTNPEESIEEVVPIEMPDMTYAKSAIIQISQATKNIGFMREVGPDHMRWVSAVSPRVLHIDFEIAAISLADNADMAAATGKLVLG